MFRTLSMTLFLAGGVLLAATGTSSASMSYTCYFDATNASMMSGTYVTVSADSASEAQQLAVAKIKELRGNDTVIKSLNCK